jgi:probable rRNA maturation factor
LHLLGYDHADPEERAEMFRLTDKIISAWAVQRPDRPRDP